MIELQLIESVTVLKLNEGEIETMNVLKEHIGYKQCRNQLG